MLIVSQWAAKSATDAITNLYATGDAEFIKSALPSVLNAWVQNAPREALEWYLAEQTKPSIGLPVAADIAFAKTAFRKLGVSNLEAVTGKIDALVSVKDILGALEGLNESIQISGASELKLSQLLEKLEVNKDAVHALKHVMEAERIVKDGVTHPDQKLQLRELLRGLRVNE